MPDTPPLLRPAAVTSPALLDNHAFRLLVDSARDYGIFMLAPTGHVISWNVGANRMTGYEAADIIGQHFSIFYPGEAVARGWPDYELRQALAEGRFEDEGWRVRKDGSQFWANVVITPVRNEEGVLIGYSKITRDLTERRAYEERLKHGEERFRLLVEGVKDYAIFMLDPNGRVASWNIGAERIKGYSASEIIGQSFTRFYCPEDVEAGKPWRNLDTARRLGSMSEEGWRLRSDGTRFMAHVTLTALYDAAGALYGFAKVTRDLTQTKRIELLEAESRFINEFLAMLAHELRNPIAPIRNAINLMEIGGVSAEKMEWCLGVIDRQTAHLARLVDDLLDVSRITRGKITLHKEKIDLSTLINRSVEASLPVLQARQHKLNVTLPQEPIVIDGDMTRLVQVISNLLNNAAKYTPVGGMVEVCTSLDGASAAIHVRDNGIGMPADLIGKVFNPFQQGSRTLDRGEGGLGIGLTLVDKIATLHGGSAEAHSEGSGKGSEFIVRLPVLAAGSHPAPPASDARPHGIAQSDAAKALRILIVDDNRDAAETMAMLIEALGHHAQTVHDGSAATAAARQYRPHLVLLDIGLPGMDGYQVARQFKSADDLRHIRVAATTGYGQDQDRKRAQDAGFDEFLVKPISFERLQDLIGRLEKEMQG